jgi:hypothetical protein
MYTHTQLPLQSRLVGALSQQSPLCPPLHHLLLGHMEVQLNLRLLASLVAGVWCYGVVGVGVGVHVLGWARTVYTHRI